MNQVFKQIDNNLKNMKKGISLITLIITIIVIIILAAIVIFTGLNTPDRANFAKFAQEFADFQTAVTQDYFNRKQQYSLEGKSLTDAQIYYGIASKTELEMEQNPTKVGTVADLGTIYPTGFTGAEIYEISSDPNVAGWKQDKKYYDQSNEKHYVTDKGEAFILPGYKVVDGNETRWYINSNKYYTGNLKVLEGGNTEDAQIRAKIQTAYNSAKNEQGKVTEDLLENALKAEFSKTNLGENWLDKTSVAEKWRITIDGVYLDVPAGISKANISTETRDPGVYLAGTDTPILKWDELVNDEGYFEKDFDGGYVRVETELSGSIGMKSFLLDEIVVENDEGESISIDLILSDEVNIISEIYEGAFGYIYIPSSVQRVENDCFANLSGLNRIIIEAGSNLEIPTDESWGVSPSIIIKE